MITLDKLNEISKDAILTYIQVAFSELNNNSKNKLRYSKMWLEVYEAFTSYLRKEGNIQQISSTHIGRDPIELAKIGNFLTEKVMDFFIPFDKDESAVVLLECKKAFLTNEINWSNEIIEEINNVIKECRLGKIKRYPNLICISCGEEIDISSHDVVFLNNRANIEEVLEKSAYLFQDAAGNFICEDCEEDRYYLSSELKRDFHLIYKDSNYEWERILTRIKELKKTKSIKDILTLLN